MDSESPPTYKEAIILRSAMYASFSRYDVFIFHLISRTGQNPPDIIGDIREVDSITGSRRSPGGGHGNPFQYSYLENHMDR